MDALDSTINSRKAIDLISQYEPCEDAVEWLSDKTASQAWETCERGDWMLWFYAREFPDNVRELTLVKGHIARTVIHLMKDQRSISAVYSAIKFGEYVIDEHDLKKAADAAYEAAQAAYAKAVAVDADAGYVGFAADAAYEAATAARFGYSATTIGYVSAPAIYAYAVAIATEARENSLKNSAEICRKYLKFIS